MGRMSSPICTLSNHVFAFMAQLKWDSTVETIATLVVSTLLKTYERQFGSFSQVGVKIYEYIYIFETTTKILIMTHSSSLSEKS